ncbi:MAG: prolipoprotein diacylglyceryl transferase [Candidatus Omnitrophota bacterium]
MFPNFINLFGVQITTYGLMIACAFAVLWLCSVSRGEKLGYPADFIPNIMMIVAVSAFVFARLLHVLVDWESYAEHPYKIVFSRDGFVYLGGFVGAIIATVVYSRCKGIRPLALGDLFAPYLALAQGIGRIGCFLFGCCYGGVCSHSWAVRFPQDSPAFYDHLNRGLIDAMASASLPVHPTQLYESFFNFAHFAVLLLIRLRQKFLGQLAMCYLMIYSAGRFAIEFFRGDFRGALGPLSTSQIMSLLLFAGGLAGYLILRRRMISPETIVLPQTES